MSYGNVYNRVLQPTLERCGLDGQRVGFHSFRRFCGSMLTEEMGRSITQVSEYLGHADKATTFGSYQHTTDKGLGGAFELEWGHPGATRATGKTPEVPQPAADDQT